MFDIVTYGVSRLPGVYAVHIESALDEFRQTSMMMRAPPWRPNTGIYPRPTRDADIGELLGWVRLQTAEDNMIRASSELEERSLIR